MHRTTLHDHELTDAGMLRRRNERCRSSIGISFSSLCILTATVVRWACRGLETTRLEIHEAIAEEAGIDYPKFDELRRFGLVEITRKESNREFYKPSRRGMLKCLELTGWRERARELARIEAAE